MVNKVRAIAEEAAQLERHERVEIIETLLNTLEPEPTEDPSVVNAAWRNEVKRRSDDLGSGAVKAVPWDQVRDEGEKLFDGD